MCPNERRVGGVPHVQHTYGYRGRRKNVEGYLLVLLHNENVLPRIDALTDLYSHTRFDADIETAIDKQAPFAVLMVKLERFTNLNIIYGTDFTNQILKKTALQFIYMMDENSAVYRLTDLNSGLY